MYLNLGHNGSFCHIVFLSFGQFEKGPRTIMDENIPNAEHSKYIANNVDPSILVYPNPEDIGLQWQHLL